MKRVRWIFLSMMACTLLNADAFATERSYIGEKWFQEGDFSFVLLEDGNAAVTAYSGSQSDVVVPNSCANRNVTEIGNLVFEGHNEIVSIEIPDTVVKLGERSIAFCDNLSYINIPESLTEIATEGIYLNEKLQIIDVSISNPVYKVEDSALIDKKKKSLVYYIGSVPEEYVIPDGIKRIEQSFMCNQENLQILIMPDSLRTIGESAFSACDNLTYISFPEGLKYIEDDAFSFCRSLNSISLPESVIGIGEYAFANCGLVDIALSGELKVLGKGAFLGNFLLQRVEIPGNVSKIGDAVFTFCNALTEIEISSENNIYEIFNNALYDKMEGRLICYPGGLYSEKYIVPNGTKTIGEWAFISCTNVEEIVIPESVERIEEDAFSHMSDESVIKVPAGSYAEQYAVENDLLYECY